MRILLVLLLLPLASGQLIAQDDGPLQMFSLQAGDPPIPHSDMSVEVWDGDSLWFATSSIHEHDGYHLFALGAPDGATVVATADASYNWTIQSEGVLSTHNAWSLQAEEQAGLLQFSPFGAPRFSAIVDNVGDTYHGGVFLQDASSLDGFGIRHGPGSLHMAGVGRYPESHTPLWLDTQTLGQPGPGLGITSLAPVCPNSILVDPPGQQFQAGTVMRFVNPTTNQATILGPAGDVAAFGQGQLARRFDPGAYVVQADGCAVPFTVLPAAEGMGNLQFELQQVSGGFAFNATATLGAATLSHYEYDVRIRDNDHLYYAGKLHGHGGGIRVHAGFGPGTYDIDIYPSPQSLDAAQTPVFSTQVTVPESDASAQSGKGAPAPFVLLPLAYALLRKRASINSQ